MTSAVTHVETETAIITEADVGVRDPDLGRRTATTALGRTATTATDEIARTAALASMAAVGMRIAEIQSVRPHPSLLKTNGIVALCLSSNLQRACELAS